MAKSTVKFQRWIPHESSSWSLQIYRRYDDELGALLTAHGGAFASVYRSLGSAGAKWSDDPAVALGVADPFLTHFKDLRQWSNAFNHFDNWVSLSTVLTVASNLETYVASVVQLALESNPGALISAPTSVDGATLIKRGVAPFDVGPHVIACTRGTWPTRLSAFQKLFGPLPQAVLARSEQLERIRNIRNRFGHAFGRDIEQSRDHGKREIRPIEKLDRRASNDLKAVAAATARDIDKFLLHNHVGDFEALRFYGSHVVPQERSRLPEARAETLKKSIGGLGANSRGKTYCQSLIAYWDSL